MKKIREKYIDQVVWIVSAVPEVCGSVVSQYMVELLGFSGKGDPLGTVSVSSVVEPRVLVFQVTNYRYWLGNSLKYYLLEYDTYGSSVATWQWVQVKNPRAKRINLNCNGNISFDLKGVLDFKRNLLLFITGFTKR